MTDLLRINLKSWVHKLMNFLIVIFMPENEENPKVVEFFK